MVCVDLDGTLTAHGGANKKGTGLIDPCREEVAEVVRALHRAGYFIVLWTARDWAELSAVQTWCMKNGIPVDEYWLNTKPPAVIFIDDRTVNPHHADWKRNLVKTLLTGIDIKSQRAIMEERSGRRNRSNAKEVRMVHRSKGPKRR